MKTKGIRIIDINLLKEENTRVKVFKESGSTTEKY